MLRLRRRWASWVWLLPTLALTTSAVAEDEPKPPSILLVVLDACRADRMSPYGYDRETTPTLDEVANAPDTVLFERHYVQAPWTKPSTASLFTGMPVSRHKVYRGHTQIAERNSRKTFVTDRLGEERETLAERLKAAGYHTFAVVWGRQLEPAYGFAQGFDTYVTRAIEPEVATDADRLQRLLGLIDTSEKPFFGYVHFEACHLPFPTRDRHSDYMREHAIPYDEAARKKAGVDIGGGGLVFEINQGGLRLEDEDADFLDLAYQAKTRQMDETIVRPLVDGLRERGLDDELVLVITADHGEELYDHGKYGHSQGLWDEIIHVPLLVRFPPGTKPKELPKKVDAPTQAIGILPSLLGVAGLPPDPGLSGANLFAGETPDRAVAEMSPIWGARGYAIIEGDHKLLHLGGANYLSNLETDPGETKNIAAKNAGKTALLAARALELKRHFSELQRSAPEVDVDLDPEAIERLKALGYME